MDLPEINADFTLEYFDANMYGVLEIAEFERAIVQMLGTSIPGFRCMKIIALFRCFVKQAADSQVSLRLAGFKINRQQFHALNKDFSASAFFLQGNYSASNTA